MKRMALIAAGALIFSLAVCVFSHFGIKNIVEDARHMRTRAIECMDAGDVQAAEVTLVNLAQHLKDKQFLLEILCEHEDLHEIKEQLIDAQASIEFGSGEDFYQAIYRFGERIEHIADVESMRFSNFY